MSFKIIQFSNWVFLVYLGLVLLNKEGDSTMLRLKKKGLIGILSIFGLLQNNQPLLGVHILEALVGERASYNPIEIKDMHNPSTNKSSDANHVWTLEDFIRLAVVPRRERLKAELLQIFLPIYEWWLTPSPFRVLEFLDSLFEKEPVLPDYPTKEMAAARHAGIIKKFFTPLTSIEAFGRPDELSCKRKLRAEKREQINLCKDSIYNFFHPFAYNKYYEEALPIEIDLIKDSIEAVNEFSKKTSLCWDVVFAAKEYLIEIIVNVRYDKEMRDPSSRRRLEFDSLPEGPLREQHVLPICHAKINKAERMACLQHAVAALDQAAEEFLGAQYSTIDP